MDDARRERFLALAWRLDEQDDIGALIDTLVVR